MYSFHPVIKNNIRNKNISTNSQTKIALMFSFHNFYFLLFHEKTKQKEHPFLKVFRK